MRALSFSLVAAIGFTLLPSASAQLQKPALRAGAAAIDITPTKFPVSVNGNMSDHKANGSHDRLHARCLVLDDGATQLAIVVVDSCMVPRPVVDRAKKLAQETCGIPALNILISATHTHTAPTLAGVFQSEPDNVYPAYLAERIATAISTAHQLRKPARLGYAVGKDATQVFNRRWHMQPGTELLDPFDGKTDLVKMNPGRQNPRLKEPAGPIDPAVSVLSVQTAEGAPVALLANYSLHYVGGVPPLSADYFGAFANRITELLKAEKTAPTFVGIMSNGTSGNINNVNFAGAAPQGQKPGEQVRIVADSVAQAAFAAYKTIEHKADVTLAVATKELQLGVRLPSADDVARAKEVLKDAQAGAQLKTIREIYARETLLLAKYPAKVPVLLQAMRIGELGIAAIPCEVFVEIGLELKQQSPLKPMFTISLANGYNGYLPTPEHHKLGGYETWRARSSYLETDAAPQITRTVLELLRQVAKR